ncbi:hypothetical protein Q4543_17710 [Salipiger sp. 1_MG-2023]|uniref:hypothetical protein n=1 Tax=Salipiger sp. 1_MG-2023 TaxID=3062665 RepID=UPI0026E46AF2|nr:hypothetical protein [Salipiger sp. 1_MG-2023]MDO6587352.1 hypothetical protein [Salipiger sp. 1_MG-2023]
MNRLTIKLPWPPAALNPNKRKHWAALAAAKAAYRRECWAEACAWGVNRFKVKQLGVHLEFYPPDRRKRDDDNMIAAFKAGRDGLADAVGVDDAEWRTTYAFPGETGGYVIAVLSEVAA